MYYKVLKNNKVIDVLDKLIYLKYQPKHKIMVLCGEDDAQAILSSGKNDFYHERTLYNIPSDADVKYENVDLVEISRFEYDKLRCLNLKTPEEIIDSFLLELINSGVV